MRSSVTLLGDWFGPLLVGNIGFHHGHFDVANPAGDDLPSRASHLHIVVLRELAVGEDALLVLVDHVIEIHLVRDHDAATANCGVNRVGHDRIDGRHHFAERHFTGHHLQLSALLLGVAGINDHQIDRRNVLAVGRHDLQVSAHPDEDSLGDTHSLHLRIGIETDIGSELADQDDPIELMRHLITGDDAFSGRRQGFDALNEPRGRFAVGKEQCHPFTGWGHHTQYLMHESWFFL